MAKIAIIGGYAPSLLNFRGALIGEMVKNGHTVLACAPDASNETIKKLHELGAEYRNIPMDRAGINPLMDLRSFLSLVFFFLKNRPDIFLGYTIKPVIFGSLAARMALVSQRYAMITGLGWSLASESDRPSRIREIVLILYRLSLRGSRRVFFQNRDDRDFFLDNSLVQSKDMTVIINGSGVDVDFYTPMPFPKNVSFLLIGRFLQDKGIYEYVAAARIVKQHYPKINFSLAGWADSNPASINSEEITSWERDGLLTCHGQLDDVREAIAAISVYVLPSYREGTPRTVLEAMAMGRPIITTDAPGCRETVNNGDNGFLVPIKDSVALADAMLKFIETPDLVRRMGQRSRNIVKKKYDVTKVNKNIMQSMGLSK